MIFLVFSLHLAMMICFLFMLSLDDLVHLTELVLNCLPAIIAVLSSLLILAIFLLFSSHTHPAITKVGRPFYAGALLHHHNIFPSGGLHRHASPLYRGHRSQKIKEAEIDAPMLKRKNYWSSIPSKLSSNSL